MTADALDESRTGRPLWLVTLADLALLLLGFFVLLQASGHDRRALASGLRAGFGSDVPPPPAMALGLARVQGFAPGSSALHAAGLDAAAEWARGAAGDPRSAITVTGEVDGSAADVDAATGSGALLAADRARAVAELLVASGAIEPDRIQIATAAGRRQVLLKVGFAGEPARDLLTEAMPNDRSSTGPLPRQGE